MNNTKQKNLLHGLISAVYTPFNEDGSLNLAEINPYVEFLIRNGMNGLYICGSTGEGVNMSVPERMAVAETFVKQVQKRVPCVIQVGANALTDCLELAAHSQAIGADAISANAPSYFRIADTATLVDWLCHIAGAAPELPFYYYHIPAFTGVNIDISEFMSLMEKRCPSFRGIKYTEMKAFAFLEGVKYGGGKYEMLWGCDEMLLTGYMSGGCGGVGSTYAMAPALYRKLIQCWNTKNLEEGQRLQLLSWQLVKVILKYSPVHPSGRLVMQMHGIKVGPCRLPYTPLAYSVAESLKSDLERIGFFDWALSESTAESKSAVEIPNLATCGEYIASTPSCNS
ncbi:MAG: dihydrodipicolinate synthase family protein [Planctomycetia bacterium]|nr:dihydrodipicolinate synthase family protein [Planctomycetia bacterium]